MIIYDGKWRDEKVFVALENHWPAIDKNIEH